MRYAVIVIDTTRSQRPTVAMPSSGTRMRTNFAAIGRREMTLAGSLAGVTTARIDLPAFLISVRTIEASMAPSETDSD